MNLSFFKDWEAKLHHRAPEYARKDLVYHSTDWGYPRHLIQRGGRSGP